MQMRKIKFSVIIPLYNKELHIGRAIQSVLNQSLQDFQLIVVDDGSMDNSAKVVENFRDERVTIIRQENAGVSAARNLGITKSQGELIAFLDADDEWLPDFLFTIERLVNKFPGAGIYATNYAICTEDELLKSPTLSEIPVYPWEGIVLSYFRSVGLGDPLVCSSAVCIPRSVFNQVGNFSIGKRMGEDLDMWGRIALQYSVVFSRYEMAIYHHEASNRACRVFNEKDENPFISTFKNYNHALIAADAVNDVYLYVNRLRLEDARLYSIIGSYVKARSLVTFSVLRSFPFRGMLWGTRLNMFAAFAWKAKNSTNQIFSSVDRK